MITIIVYIIIIGLVWALVDKFLLRPYTPPVVRYIVAVILTVIIIVMFTNGMGWTHIALPRR